MKRSRNDPLLRFVESFFRDYLTRMRGASPHTIAAYKNTLRLFFIYLADSLDSSVADLHLEHLTVERVLDFLDYLETERGNSAATRNYRLSCLRSLFRHFIRRDPTRAAQYQRVLSLPSKKQRRASICYLEPEEIQVLLRQPDRRTRLGIRDYALMLFLYNTGARIGEALTMKVAEIQLARPRQVLFHGKGRKDRICPIWPMTASAVRALLSRWGTEPSGHLFRNARGEPLGRDGAAYIIDKHFTSAARSSRSLRRKHITPHVLRHSCAVGLLQAGVDITVIRDYLGHESVATTGRYTKTNLQTKRTILDAFWERAGLGRPATTGWRPEPKLLAFLTSL